MTYSPPAPTAPLPQAARTRPRSSVLPPGYNWLSVPIPRTVHSHVHHQARLSNMSLRDYLASFLLSATPFVPDGTARPAQDPATTGASSTGERQ